MVVFGSRRGVTNSLFVSAVILLVLVAAFGFGLYATKPSVISTTTVMNTFTATQMDQRTLTEMMKEGNAFQFTPKSGAMIGTAQLLVVPLEMHEYVVAIRAEGLEPNRTYLVQGPLATGAMQAVPISTKSMHMNAPSASEFMADSKGRGLYWIVLGSNPAKDFEAIQLYFLPGMEMRNAQLVASVNFSRMSGG